MELAASRAPGKLKCREMASVHMEFILCCISGVLKWWYYCMDAGSAIIRHVV